MRRSGTAIVWRIAFLVVCATWLVPAAGQGWPSGPIKIVVPFPPGGSVDAIPRMLQQGLQERLGVPIVVENKPGASGMIGAAAVASAEPNGTTWLFIADTLAVSAALYPNRGFDAEKDLAPVLLVGTTPYLLATNPAKPFKTLTDVIAAAKAKPGTVTYGSYGTGSGAHLAMLQLSKNAGVSMNHIPYKGTPPALSDAIAGHIDLVITTPSNVIPQLKAGKLRAIAQFSDARRGALKDIPTTAESGLPCNECVTWYGFFTRAGTPKAIIERFRAELVTALRGPDVQKQLEENMQVTILLQGPDELRQFLAEQVRIWGNVIQANHIKAD
jgi:tripartite-type tricarboxylate transporter receptor subunit TctC